MRFLLNKKQTVEERLDCIGHTLRNTSDSTSGNTNDSIPVNISKKLEDFSTGECPATESEPMLETYDETTPEDLKELIKEVNEEIKKAEEHVKMHTAQREQAKEWIETAKQDHKYD